MVTQTILRSRTLWSRGIRDTGEKVLVFGPVSLGSGKELVDRKSIEMAQELSSGDPALLRMDTITRGRTRSSGFLENLGGAKSVCQSMMTSHGKISI